MISGLGHEHAIARGQNFESVLGDQDRMLGLSAEPSIDGDRRPTILEDDAVWGSFVDHRFDCERHAGGHSSTSAAFVDVLDPRLSVKLASDPVTTKRFDDPVAVLLRRELVDDGSDVPNPFSRRDFANPEPHRMAGDVDEAECGLTHFPDRVHFRRVAMKSVENDGDVDIDDVPFDEGAWAGNPVTDHFVDGRADRLGKALVVERRWDRVVFNNEVVTQLVEFVGRDTRRHVGGDKVENFASQPSSGTHFLDFGFVVDVYRHRSTRAFRAIG